MFLKNVNFDHVQKTKEMQRFQYLLNTKLDVILIRCFHHYHFLGQSWLIKLNVNCPIQNATCPIFKREIEKYIFPCGYFLLLLQNLRNPLSFCNFPSHSFNKKFHSKFLKNNNGFQFSSKALTSSSFCCHTQSSYFLEMDAPTSLNLLCKRKKLQCPPIAYTIHAFMGPLPRSNKKPPNLNFFLFVTQRF